MRRHPRRAAVDPSSPRAWATDDRSGFVGNLENMRWQYDWRGTRLVNLNVLVYEDQYDDPQRQLGTIVLPPDPPPLLNTRPEQYYIDERTQRAELSGQIRYQLDGTIRILSNAQGT